MAVAQVLSDLDAIYLVALRNRTNGGLLTQHKDTRAEFT